MLTGTIAGALRALGDVLATVATAARVASAVGAHRRPAAEDLRRLGFPRNAFDNLRHF
ncbi:hypothetical protein [Amaricoccus solimangrovi]|uniref:hypothetical protein n=1 Tax=Amaricoccus solimangrovi TaxID=2589815 RepID=UPI0015E3315C|nr:hypothetical protein [Amaricoccus solimangrovi]